MTENQRNRPPTHDVSNYRILRVLQAGAGEPRNHPRHQRPLSLLWRHRSGDVPERRPHLSLRLSVTSGSSGSTSATRAMPRSAAFDDALAKSSGAVLTVGGTQGKRNKVRQTGRTTGPASIRHSVEDGQRSISMRDQRHALRTARRLHTQDDGDSADHTCRDGALRARTGL